MSRPSVIRQFCRAGHRPLPDEPGTGRTGRGRLPQTCGRATRRRAWRAGAGVALWLGVAGAAAAQRPTPANDWPGIPAPAARLEEWHLTVRPRAMATGTENPAAGVYVLAPDSSVMVTVPPRCAGKHRCPLVVALPGGGFPASQTTEGLRPSADEYGLIILTTSFEGRPGSDGTPPAKIDSAMKETLRRFAIDPEKIAVIGRCASTPAAELFALVNPGLFSRVALVSSGLPLIGRTGVWDLSDGPLFTGGALPPPAPGDKTEYLIDDGVWEGQPSGAHLVAVRALRRAGYAVEQHVGLRGHSFELEDNAYVAYWLRRSWDYPDRAKRPRPAVVADPLPVVTAEALAKMTAFWGRFAQQPDSVREAGRRSTLREVSLPVWTEHVTTWLMDVGALAKRYPAVAEALRAAGLTAREHDAYRVALLSALASSDASRLAGPDVSREAKDVEQKLGPLDPRSAVARNIAFVTAHPDEMKALVAASAGGPPDSLMTALRSKWSRQGYRGVGERAGVGVWYTP